MAPSAMPINGVTNGAVVTSSSAPDPEAIVDSTAPHENEWYNQDFDGYRIDEHPLFEKRPIRMICVGAGAAGLQIAYKAERALENVTLQIYEKNHDIGGTWLENRYPGCTCDIPSHSYQFTWARNPKWSAFYSSATEIWQYFKDVATKYDLEKYVKFNTKVESAVWNEEEGLWKLTLIGPDGAKFHDECEILANGSGNLKYVLSPTVTPWGDAAIVDKMKIVVRGSGRIFLESRHSRGNSCTVQRGTKSTI